MRLCLLLLLAGCDNVPQPVFIALDRDFAPFRRWESIDLGDEQIQGHPAGHAWDFINQRTRGSRYAVGTVIVKAFEPSWELFAMAKRGGGFNPKGAVDWEFFRLKLVGDTPVIVSRGIFAVDPDSDAGVGYNSTGSVLSAGIRRRRA
jgi:hypothetical protein